MFTISLSTIGAFFLGIYLLSIGLTALFRAKIPNRVMHVSALITGACILLGVFVTYSITIN